VEQALAGGRLTLAATGFAQRFSDLIQYTFAVAAPTDPNFYNVASATASGVELEVHATPAAALHLEAQYTWLRTATADSGFDGTVFAPGQRLLRRPTHSGSVSAEWRGAPVRLGLRVLAVGSRDDLDFGTFPTQRVVLPAYGRLDLWGELPAWHPGTRTAFTLTARVDNATGEQYAEVAGFPAPGRRALVGVRVEGAR
jgi:outer membrane cobalamin receptor